LRKGGKSPSTETNEQNSLRRPGPTRGCRANDDDEVTQKRPNKQAAQMERGTRTDMTQNNRYGFIILIAQSLLKFLWEIIVVVKVVIGFKAYKSMTQRL
jgi:hypothetical protein